MEYTKLGNTGVDVSRICLGCMGFGDAERWIHKWVLNEENSRPIRNARFPRRECHPPGRVSMALIPGFPAGFAHEHRIREKRHSQRATDCAKDSQARARTSALARWSSAP
jgi:hypothetical protein